MWRNPSIKQGTIIFVVLRVLLTVWALVATTLLPVPTEPDEVVRPYLGEPQLSEGVTGALLGPWQRFDTQHYLRIARQGYADESDSVFPPLYPLAVRVVGTIGGGSSTANLIAALVIANLACWGLFILLHHVTMAELGEQQASRALLYFALYPTAFFLFAGYTESLFILLALGSVWSARNGRYWQAGFLGLFASLTRLTGWVLVIPIAFEIYQSIKTKKSPSSIFNLQSLLKFFPALLPGFGLLLFMAYRWWLGLPALPVIYEQYWYQVTSFPGRDVATAVVTLFFNGIPRNNEIISLSFDFFSLILLIMTTIYAFHRLGMSYGLYSALLLLFMLLPTSEVKPLYSFSRYVLAFFPTFMVLAIAGQKPLLHRLILYPSLILYLFFSGQFFIWGWVA